MGKDNNGGLQVVAQLGCAMLGWESTVSDRCGSKPCGERVRALCCAVSFLVFSWQSGVSVPYLFTACLPAKHGNDNPVDPVPAPVNGAWPVILF